MRTNSPVQRTARHIHQHWPLGLFGRPLFRTLGLRSGCTAVDCQPLQGLLLALAVPPTCKLTNKFIPTPLLRNPVSTHIYSERAARAHELLYGVFCAIVFLHYVSYTRGARSRDKMFEAKTPHITNELHRLPVPKLYGSPLAVQYSSGD